MLGEVTPYGQASCLTYVRTFVASRTFSSKAVLAHSRDKVQRIKTTFFETLQCFQDDQRHSDLMCCWDDWRSGQPRLPRPLGDSAANVAVLSLKTLCSSTDTAVRPLQTSYSRPWRCDPDVFSLKLPILMCLQSGEPLCMLSSFFLNS